ncbi:MAG: hypothetical protein QOJ21_3050 [Solirubrobacteraceae bacterium]|jgi:hypothetical protein|nr:hypothetical protein [Solirubrobacteraceae bacterium]
MRLRLGVVGLVVVVVVVVAVVVAIGRRSSDPPRTLAPAAGNTKTTIDPLAWDPDRRAEFERRAAAGLAHVLYVKSPGGVIASAERTARWRPLVERVAAGAKLDPDTLEAIVMLESAGREDARASNHLDGAVGLTQILAETGTSLLGMRIDVRASERLTRGIARGRRVEARVRARRRVDERFDPAKALQATARYLQIARRQLGRDDLAIVSYHMGIGNLQGALSAYGRSDIPYARLFFDSTPLRHSAAWSRLAALGDDSSTYLWRIMAARDVMRMYRRQPQRLVRLALLQTRKNSAEEVLHPPDRTPTYGDPFAVGRARASGELVALDRTRLTGAGVRIDPRMGELARRLKQSPRLYRALRPQALHILEVLGAGTRAISRSTPLTVTSTVRDARYQRLLVSRNPEATRNFSLHTTGWAFDISRHYRSRAQALAFQFMLDRLTALNMIAWVREPTAIHVTVAAPR